MKNLSKLTAHFLLILVLLPQHNAALADVEKAGSLVSTVKIVVDDMNKNKAFYQTYLKMEKQGQYNDKAGNFEEIFLHYPGESKTRLALYSPKSCYEKPLAKSQHPVVLFYIPNLNSIATKLQTGGFPVRFIGSEDDALFIVITQDPAGNVVELVSRANEIQKIGGAKLNVENRQQAEDFYSDIFSVSPLRYYKKDGAYDEVLMDFDDGVFLALFESKTEQPLPKSRFPVAAIYVNNYGKIASKLKSKGIEYNEFIPGKILLSEDPSGNVIEVIQAK